MNQELQPYDNFDGSVTEVVAAPSSGDRFSTAASLRMQVQRYWVALRKRWWIVALCLVFIGGPALVYAYIKKPSFESQAIMWLTSRLSLPGGAGFFSEEVSSYMNTQAELM